MTDPHQPLPWSQPGWLDEVTAWVAAQLARLGLRAAGPLEVVRTRPWSTVLRVPADDRPLFFKATAPLDRHEVPLTLALARWRPDTIPVVLAADLERGWLLLADAGVRLRELLAEDRDWRRWRRVLRVYADLQLEASAHVEELLALGVPDRRPAALPAALARLVEDRDTLRVGLPDGLTADEYARLLTIGPLLAEQAARLEALGVPPSIDHCDFHDGNVFLHGDRPVLIDWGDACVAHPFSSLLVAMRGIEHALGLDQRSPELAELRDLYLEPWRGFAPPAALRDALALARWLAMLIRALTWQRVVAPLSAVERTEYADAVPGWLRELIEATPA